MQTVTRAEIFAQRVEWVKER